MRRSFVLITLAVIFIIFSAVFAYNNLAKAQNDSPDQATIDRASAEYFSKICSGHGGINCSVINADSSIICNDGTIDNSLVSIYSVPQCREKIRTKINEQSDFMAKTGCFPPSELRCINEISYQNTYRKLSSSGLVNSELGRWELSQCLKQIDEFKQDEKNYRQCLINNNRADFELSGKIVLPVLKTLFCPVFYGNKSSYDQSLDLCVCQKGYFIENEQCVAADQLCKLRYGTFSYAQNGSCLQKNTSFSPAITTKTPPPINSSRTPAPTTYTSPRAYFEPTDNPETGDYQPETALPDASEQKNGIMGNIISSIISSIKNLFKFNLF